MAKYKSTQKKMVDMTNRLQIKVVSATEEEVEENNADFIRLNETILQKIQRENERIDENIRLSLLKEKAINDITSKDYIQYYNSKFADRNKENIKDKIEAYRKYLSEAEVWEKNK